MRTFLLFLHIAAAGAWVGTSLTQFALLPLFRTSAPSTHARWHLGTVALGTRVYTPAAVVILITGVLLVTGNASFGFADAFVSLGFLTVIVGAALGMAVFGPRGRETAELLEAGDEARANAVIRRIRAFGALDLGLVLLTILAMVAKFGSG